MKRVIAISLLAACALTAQEYTRGIGVYPGNPSEDFSPTAHLDKTSYRNLALRRPAYQSSGYDYNLTAQLITDGIKETQLPRWVATTTSAKGLLPRTERELLLDHNWATTIDLSGKEAWVQFELGGGASIPEVDRFEVDAAVEAKGMEPQEWTLVISSSADGQSWKEVGRTYGRTLPTGALTATAELTQPASSRFYRLTFESGREFVWHIAEVKLSHQGLPVELGGPYNFSSSWKSGGAGQEWVYVDLGAVCDFDTVKLYWLQAAAEGALQVSDDAVKWRDAKPLPTSGDLTQEIKFDSTLKGRYVRVLMNRPASSGGYILSEMEVFGRGGPVLQPKAAPRPATDGSLNLAGGAWRLQRASLVNATGEELSQSGFKNEDWLIASVPATTLASYVNAGAVPDPNYSDNQLQVSDSFFYSDFWYRDEFIAPKVDPGKHVWLNFDGIDWKANVFLNGRKLGRIEGAFTRKRFDVAGSLHAGQANFLAVLVEKNSTPGSITEKTFDSPGKNGGALGLDNPTFHASIGWDWIPTVRGRDTGIWSGVSLTVSGPVTIENPFVATSLPLPDTSRADIAMDITLQNHESQPQTGTLRGRFGDVAFDQPVSIEASGQTTVKLNPSNQPALRLRDPKLWWPNGYGAPNLYDVELRFDAADGSRSDTKKFKAGVRQFSYTEDGGALRIFVNGRRFIARGGNWGFSESMLRYRAREYDVAARYHQDMNFTMVRNWVGQIGDDAFYEACDRHGIVVWEDFWLANPWDGADPTDNAMFLQNLQDTILRVRNHPSIGLYCGRNEGFPPDPLERGIRKALAELHPGIEYIPSSADNLVSGHGPYMAMPPKFYFTERATTELHSELGMPNIMSMDSLRLMLPESALWPQGRLWGVHDFSLHGAQGGESFIQRIEKSYGPTNNVQDWVSLAQFVNYEGYRAMFEAQSRNRMGLLIWMSHPAWPSLVWQTYDYYFEPTAAYFGAKKASEPLHIQWNPVSDDVEVVNYSAGNATGLTAHVQVFNQDGSRQWDKTAALDSREDSTTAPLKMEYPAGLSPLYFVKLQLLRGSVIVSDNVYWRGTKEDDYTALRSLPKVKLHAVSHASRHGDTWQLATELANTSNTPAVMIRLKAVRTKTGDRILPALYSDNYLTLMPGEKRTITTELAAADTRGEEPRIAVEGFNCEPQ